jgi:mediator of RNA polymerase II transcription subunit 10
LSGTALSVQIDIPPEVISYVQRMNQMLNGRVDAYRMLQQQLARQISSAIPELKDDVTSVVESTGGEVLV